MNTVTITICLLLLVTPPTLTLDCYVGAYEPDKSFVVTKTLTCPPNENVCYEYEGNSNSPKRFRLVYNAGCDTQNVCDRDLNQGDCSKCNTDLCNTRLLKRLQAANHVCLSYSATFYVGEENRLVSTPAVCPSGESRCFLAHLPTGSAFSAWTRVFGGCGNATTGCTHKFPPRLCTVCEENECNSPLVPTSVTRFKFGGESPYKAAVGLRASAAAAWAMLVAYALAVTMASPWHGVNQ